jgi:hypothetical protein
MATENPFLTTSKKNPFLEEKPESAPESEGGFVGAAKQAGAGLLESVPFYGEKLAKSTGIPEPSSLIERTTRRAARNAPYALLASTGVGAIPAAVGLGASTLAGQAAEELGVPKEYQSLAEVLGGGASQLGRAVSGRTLGYIQKPLEELYTKGSKLGYELGPGAKTSQGMKYGAGADEASSIRNLEKFTEEATKRSGNPTKVVNADWIKNTQNTLGNEVNSLFAGKTFSSTPKYQQNIQNIVNQAEGVFGEQGNIARTIIARNIGGQRTGGSLLSPSFKAEDLRGAITQVNDALSGAKGPQAKILHDLKDSLEDLAQSNLPKNLADQYSKWRSKYNSFSTLRDAIQAEGKTGITTAGQVNPKKLLDIITSRTGGDATRSPLYKNLAELGDILESKVVQSPGVLKAALASGTESPLAKFIQAGLQQRAPKRGAGILGSTQTVAPLGAYTQVQGQEQ